MLSINRRESHFMTHSVTPQGDAHPGWFYVLIWTWDSKNLIQELTLSPAPLEAFLKLFPCCSLPADTLVSSGSMGDFA